MGGFVLLNGVGATLVFALFFLAGCLASQAGPQTGQGVVEADSSACDLSFERGLKIGQVPTDFSLFSTDGRNVTLSGFCGSGKLLIVNFYASWCPFCPEEMRAFQKEFVKRQGQIDVLAINLQEDAKVAGDFARAQGATYTVLLDPDSQARRVFQVRSPPVTYFINSSGVIVEKRLGPLLEEEITEKIDSLLEGGA
ncbi:MAG: TlpA family protein disulfide reductase [Candidatus Micrarchaeia archaeon]